MELIEGSETSAIINQTPGNYPKEGLLQVSVFFFAKNFYIALLRTKKAILQPQVHYRRFQLFL